jgi:hypothetical protein
MAVLARFGGRSEAKGGGEAHLEAKRIGSRIEMPECRQYSPRLLAIDPSSPHYAPVNRLFEFFTCTSLRRNDVHPQRR